MWNPARIESELASAAQEIEELQPDFRTLLVTFALECIADEAEHVDKKIFINQRFDGRCTSIAARISAAEEEADE